MGFGSLFRLGVGLGAFGIVQSIHKTRTNIFRVSLAPCDPFVLTHDRPFPAFVDEIGRLDYPKIRWHRWAILDPQAVPSDLPVAGNAFKWVMGHHLDQSL